jgi:hypothetical protein
MLKRRQLELSAKRTVTVTLLFGGSRCLRELNVGSNAQTAPILRGRPSATPLQPSSVKKVGDEQ